MTMMIMMFKNVYREKSIKREERKEEGRFS